MKKIIISGFFVLITFCVLAQERTVTIFVTDEFNNPVSEAVVEIIGNTIETFTTDKNGYVVLPAIMGEEVRVVAFNKQMRTFKIDAKEMNVNLGKYDRILDVGYDEKTTKQNSSAAMNGVSSQEIEASGQLNILNSLYGLIPGLQVFQANTDPWNSTPGLRIRGRGSFAGNNLLVLVDGIERDPSKINRKEIESVTVLKDAASLSLYGNRGADGVINFTTKRGGNHKLRIQAGYNHSIQFPFRIPEMAKAPAYALALNEALENDGLSPKYTQRDILSMSHGEKTSLLPNINWQKELLRDAGFNNEADMELDGSTKRTRYYVYTNYSSNRGLLNNTKLNKDYSTQAEVYALKVRTNLETYITPTTVARMNVLGRLLQSQQPTAGLALDAMYHTPAAAFPIKNENQWVRDQMFSNPLAEKIARGYNVMLERTLFGDLTIDQDLSLILKGLSAQFRLAYDNSAHIIDSKTKSYSYLDFIPVRDEFGNIERNLFTKYGNDTELGFGSWLSSQVMRTSVWGKIDYVTHFGKHRLDASGIFSQNYSKYLGANNSYMYRDYLANIAYNYDNRYIVNGVVSYSGSGKLVKGDKYRIYPAISAAWVLSNEEFFNKNKNIEHLKVRASFGIAGMDRNLSYDMDKQFNGGGRGYIFVGTQWKGGLGEGALPSSIIEPERDYKTNVGVELALWKGLTMEIDGFYNRRKNIKVSATGTTSSVLGIGITDLCTGEVNNYGGEFSIDWNEKIKDFNYYVHTNISYAKNKIINMEEGYRPHDYMKIKGRSIGQFYGLIADGLFQESDFNGDGNLKEGIPSPAFIQKVQPGDIKYKDLNNDKIINEYDYTYALKSWIPEVYYGLSLGAEYKNIGLSCIFQGVARSTVVTELSSIYRPLYGNNKNISSHYLENYWSPYTPNARYPRLTTLPNANNFRYSTLWTEKGDFLKLRNLEVTYNIPRHVVEKIRIMECKLIVRGTNLFSIDHFKIMDPEQINMNYPSLRSYSIGINVLF